MRGAGSASATSLRAAARAMYRSPNFPGRLAARTKRSENSVGLDFLEGLEERGCAGLINFAGSVGLLAQTLVGS